MPQPPEARPRPAVAAIATVSRGQPLTPKIATAKTAVPTFSPPFASNASAKKLAASRDHNSSAAPLPPHSSYSFTSRPGGRHSRLNSGYSSPARSVAVEAADSLNVAVTSTTTAAIVAGPATQPFEQPAQPLLRASNFVYANGDVVDRGPASYGQSPSASSTVSSLFTFTPVLDSRTDTASSKFIYADGRPDLEPSTGRTVSPGSAASSLSATRTARSEHHLPLPRPSSPVKQQPSQLLSHTATTSSSYQPFSTPPLALKTSVSPSSCARIPFSCPRPPSFAPSAGLPRRKISIDTAPAPFYTHARSDGDDRPYLERAATTPMPTSSAGSFIVGPCALNTSLRLATPPQPLVESSPPLPPSPHSFLFDLAPADMHSPTKSTFSTDVAVSELVANARHERKVQDLEITNASLEAINRTLERQLRKQTSEMRRFRRLSLASFASRSRNASGAGAVVVPSNGTGLPELSDLDDDDEDDDGEAEDGPDDGEDDGDTDLLRSASSSLRTSSSGSDSGPDPARRRRRDRRRLRLDLAKHRQLLVDSQRLNQSLKRCLDWSEEMIRDGQRALAYRVHVSDVRLGGRVLSPDDEPEPAAGVVSADLPPPEHESAVELSSDAA